MPDEIVDGPNRSTHTRLAYAETIRWLPCALLCAGRDDQVVAFACPGPPAEPVVDAGPTTLAHLVGLFV